MMQLRLLTAIAVILSPTSLSMAAVEIHVATSGSDDRSGSSEAPFASIHRAIDELARLRQTGVDSDVHVVIHEGTYRVAEPLVIGPEHLPAGGNAVIFRSATDAKPVISGGQQLSEWQLDASGTLTTQVPDKEAGKWRFRELFINGERRPRARHPNSGYARIVESFPDKRTGFTFNPGDLPDAMTSGGELVFLHDWSISRIAIKSVDHAAGTLTVEHPIGNRADHYKIDHFEKHPRYFVENHSVLLDSPGEWYLDDDSGLLTYWPKQGETVENIRAVAPVASSLLIVRGTSRQPVANLQFRNLAWEHCAWSLPPGGYASGQATVHEQRDNSDRYRSRKMMESAVTFELAESCSLVNCRIAHIGCSGLAFGSRTTACSLLDSVVEDISGNGVNLGEDTSRRVDSRVWWQAAPEQIASRNAVKRNLIRTSGQQFYGAVAVWAGLVDAVDVSHNEIREHPYTGVSLGWMWNPTPTPAGKNLVTHNHIHHIMQRLSDGGGIYTLGRQPGTVLSHNRIHDVPVNAGRAESNGMFLDEGSDQITISDNTIYDIARSPLRFHKAVDITVENNVLVSTDATIPALRYNNTDPTTVRQTGNTPLLRSEFDPLTH
jgi:hypothetical protein